MAWIFKGRAVSVGEDKDFCLNLDRCILLAYLIQSELRPLDTKRDNPYMSNQRLSEYASSCMLLEFKALDEAFNYYFFRSTLVILDSQYMTCMVMKMILNLIFIFLLF